MSSNGGREEAEKRTHGDKACCFSWLGASQADVVGHAPSTRARPPLLSRTVAGRTELYEHNLNSGVK